MLARLVEALFGCRHDNYSFPITIKPGRRRGNAGHARTYVVCLECGQERAYDWVRMKVTAESKAHVSASEAGASVPARTVVRLRGNRPNRESTSRNGREAARAAA